MPVMIKQLTRKNTLELLQNINQNLRTATSYKDKYLNQFIVNPWDQDRHFSIGTFSKPEKTSDSFQQSNLLFFEIDDLELKENIKRFNPDIKTSEYIRMKIQEHEAIIRNSMEEFFKRVNINLSVNQWPFPTLITYSGNKSFHFIYQFDRFVSKEEYIFCKKQFQSYQQVLLKNAEKYPFSSKLDLNVTFSHAHMPRFSCDIPEDNRKPQISFVYEDHSEKLSAELFLSVIQEHDKLNHIVFKSFSTNPKINYSFVYRDYYTQRQLEDILDQSITPTQNPEKYLIHCTNPNHNDSSKSAFISHTGFVYCTVCCKTGKKWISRISKKGEIIHNGKE